MKTPWIALIVAVTLWLGMAAPAQGQSKMEYYCQPPKDLPTKYATKKYKICTPLDKKFAVKVTRLLELFHRKFAQVFRFKKQLKLPQTAVYVYPDQKSYAKFCKSQEKLAKFSTFRGFYYTHSWNPNRPVGYRYTYIIVLWNRPWKGFSNTLLHELTHIFTHFHFKNVPHWFNEGLAAFLATARVKGRRIAIGEVDEEYLATYKRLVKNNRVPPLKTLLEKGKDQTLSHVEYAQSWALMHYLLKGGGNRRLRAVNLYLMDCIRKQRITRDFYWTHFAKKFRLSPEKLSKRVDKYIKKL